MKRVNDFYTTRCIVCGKEIWMIDPVRWAYAVKSGANSTRAYCCSWHCLRAAPQSHHRGEKVGKKEMIFKLLRDGKQEAEIAEIAKVTIGTVKYWKARYVE